MIADSGLDPMAQNKLEHTLTSGTGPAI
jgi:hypothetical protein